jgi:hypothetical protein
MLMQNQYHTNRAANAGEESLLPDALQQHHFMGLLFETLKEI